MSAVTPLIETSFFSHGTVECETDRGRFLGRGRGPADPQALIVGRAIERRRGTATLRHR